MTHAQELVVLPSLRANVHEDGRVRITRKFLDGMQRYADRWPGPVTAILHPEAATQSGNLDDVLVDTARLNFDLRVIPFDSHELKNAIRSAAIVQGGGDFRLNYLPEFCKASGIPYIFVSEYTLRTRNQIIKAETPNPARRLRRYVWAWNQERKNRRGVALSAGVQCNGVPTFKDYQPLNDNALLYFDSRIKPEMLPRSPTVVGRLRPYDKSRPMRLAFSGRLNRMKGADDLLQVAKHLRALSVPFILDVCGDGDLMPDLRREVERNELREFVRLRGVLDFESELVPFIRDEVDLFVCCHRQGDPSCTYVETLACGVPIVGYDNEALAGLLERCPAGWHTKMGETKALAQRIAELRDTPEALIDAAVRGLDFARGHTADETFEARIQHMLTLSRSSSRMRLAASA